MRKNYLLLNVLLFFYSISSVCSKQAGKKVLFSKEWIFFYGMSVGILFGYAILWQKLLKKLSLVNAYANKAVTVIWGIIWGKLFFHENITIGKVVGSVIVGIGIYFVVLEGNPSHID